MDGSKDVDSDIFEINSQKYLVPTVITSNGRTVLDYDRQLHNICYRLKNPYTIWGGEYALHQSINWNRQEAET